MGNCVECQQKKTKDVTSPIKPLQRRKNSATIEPTSLSSHRCSNRCDRIIECDQSFCNARQPEDSDAARYLTSTVLTAPQCVYVKMTIIPANYHYRYHQISELNKGEYISNNGNSGCPGRLYYLNLALYAYLYK